VHQPPVASTYSIHRKSFDATRTETLRASVLLMKAVGITYDQLKPSNSFPLNFTAHRGILRELAFALEVQSDPLTVFNYFIGLSRAVVESPRTSGCPSN